MFDEHRWIRLLVLGCLLVFLGCFGNDSSTTKASKPAKESESTKQNATIQQPLAEKQDGATIYKAAVPELREFTWADTRVFNLPLNNPPYVRPAKANFLRGEDVVLGVMLGKEARAYPWNLLANYHAVNDQLAGKPIIVNLCEACNGGAAFLATLPDTVLDMRPRGLKNGTWYGIDFQTGSLWYPFIGEAFEGPLKGTKLTRIRVYFSSWEDWVRDHPNTTVAVTSDEVRMRPHGRASKMAADSTFNPAFLKRITDPKPNPKRDLLPGHTLVFGLIPKAGDAAKAFTVKSLSESKTLIQTKINATPILLMIQNEYQIGAYQRKFQGIELKMKIIKVDPLLMSDQFGNQWNMWGRTISGRDHPAELNLVDGYMAKWYEWVENFPDTELVAAE
ncbi:MAG: hypothetical protein ACI87E_004656 [Mariniblastus sp.]|jgi:hypothetical protein